MASQRDCNVFRFLMTSVVLSAVGHFSLIFLSSALEMLANRAVLNTLLKKNLPVNVTQVATHATGGFHDERYVIGKREWVGYGSAAQPHYQDRPDYPMPAVRFREITGDLVALREKEKKDWKNLTIDEKKKLYRASFCQTLAEEEAPTGLWKSILGCVLGIVSMGMWVYIMQKQFIYRPKPHTFSEEYRAATLRRLIDLKYGHVSGIASKWDYEKDDWKK